MKYHHNQKLPLRLVWCPRPYNNRKCTHTNVNKKSEKIYFLDKELGTSQIRVVMETPKLETDITHYSVVKDIDYSVEDIVPMKCFLVLLVVRTLTMPDNMDGIIAKEI